MSYPPYTPQQNSVVERENKMLIDMARTMHGEYKTPVATLNPARDVRQHEDP
jgi:hypothetical protein